MNLTYKLIYRQPKFTKIKCLICGNEPVLSTVDFDRLREMENPPFCKHIGHGTKESLLETFYSRLSPDAKCIVDKLKGKSLPGAILEEVVKFYKKLDTYKVKYP